jgi:ribosomal-protein-alanine N-acetyltransferase
MRNLHDKAVGFPSPEMVVFRRMTVKDIDTIVEIEKECFTVPWTREAFYNELMYNQFAHYFVMLWQGEIIGYGGLWTIVDEAHVTNIGLREAYRGRKLGQRLLRELIAFASLRGMKRMTLEVRVSNTVAQRLYEKFGFRVEGVRRGYYSDNGEDALIMWADIPDIRPAQ